MTDDPRPARPADGSLEVVEYRAEWLQLFESERDLLQERLGHVFVRIEHIGSTAVPGMPSKPTIDIAGAVERVHDILEELGPLYALGYDYRPATSESGDAFFRKVRNGKRTHHLHVVAADGPELADYLAFRQFLTTDAAAAHEYATKKRALFARFLNDRMGYVEAKELVVEALMARMRRVR
jgi:GrpB-like predicted nucleotidyltransferase (UPF0157 family)